MSMLSRENVFTHDPTDSTYPIAEATATATGVFSQEIEVQDVAGVDHGIGLPPLYVWASIAETYNNLTDLTITIRTSDTAPAGTPGTGTTLLSRTVVLADLEVGDPLILKPTDLPEGCQKYIWAEWAVSGTLPTTGKVTVAITRDKGSWYAYPAHTGR